MSKAAFTLKVFAVYLFVLGLVLLAAPNPLLALFGFPPSHEVWVRVLGVVVINLGVYYWYGAASEARPLFGASVATRLFVLVAFIGLVAAGLVQPMLILFGAVDALGGLWTLQALRSERRKECPPRPTTDRVTNCPGTNLPRQIGDLPECLCELMSPSPNVRRWSKGPP